MNTFPNVNLVQAALFSSTGVTIQTGKKFTLALSATTALEAVPKQQLDSEIATVTKLITDLTSGAPGAADTLKELYDISQTIKSEGVTAVSDEVTARIAAISQEVLDRNTAIGSAISTEVADRNTAIGVEATARSTADTTETTARIAKDAELDSRLFTIIDAALSSAIVPDAQQPAYIPTAVLALRDENAVVQDGWYYKNQGPAGNGSLNKINWYTSPNATTVGELKAINMIVNCINTVSTPFMTVYTKFQGPTTVDGINNWGVGKQNAASWYHGRYTFIRQSGGVSVKGKYNFRVSLDKIVDNLVVLDGTAPYIGSALGHTNSDLTLSVFNSTVAGNTSGLAVIPFLATDEILSCSFGTDSSSSPGNVEFILSGINYYCTPGNLGYRFSNNSVVSKAVMNANGWA